MIDAKAGAGDFSLPNNTCPFVELDKEE